jgi:hypothetical protein
MAPVLTAQPLKHSVKDENGQLYPLFPIQITELACGGFVLALKGSANFISSKLNLEAQLNFLE